MRLSTRQAQVVLVLITLALFAFAATARANGESHIYFFTQPSCPPCRQVEAQIDRLQQAKYPVTTVNFQANPKWAEQFGIARTPTTIITNGNQVVFRQEGYISAEELAEKFRSLNAKRPESSASTANQNTAAQNAAPQTATTQTGNENWQNDSPAATTAAYSNSESFDQVPPQQRAMQATVRLKVEDPEGTSYATGTVIHSHGGEALVVTCGHVFRDSKGTGVISADFGFAQGNKQTVPGKLLYYDADHRDIALVAITPGVEIPPVIIAPRGMQTQRGDQLFSVGCDRGADPTIRKHTMKRTAKYNG